MLMKIQFQSGPQELNNFRSCYYSISLSLFSKIERIFTSTQHDAFIYFCALIFLDLIVQFSIYMGKLSRWLLVSKCVYFQFLRQIASCYSYFHELQRLRRTVIIVTNTLYSTHGTRLMTYTSTSSVVSHCHLS